MDTSPPMMVSPMGKPVGPPLLGTKPIMWTRTTMESPVAIAAQATMTSTQHSRTRVRRRPSPDSHSSLQAASSATWIDKSCGRVGEVGAVVCNGNRAYRGDVNHAQAPGVVVVVGVAGARWRCVTSKAAVLSIRKRMGFYKGAVIGGG